MNKIIFLLISITMLISCSKNDDPKYLKTEIKGNVIDYYSRHNIPDIKINLSIVGQQDPSNQALTTITPFSPSNYIHEIKSDSNGYFLANYDLLENGDYRLVLTNDSMVSNIAYNIKVGQLNNIDVEVKTLKTAKITFKSDSLEIDLISLSILNDIYILSGYSEYYRLEDSYYDLNPANDFPLIYNLIPDTYCDFWIFRGFNGTFGKMIDTTIYIQNIDTNFVDLVY